MLATLSFSCNLCGKPLPSSRTLSSGLKVTFYNLRGRQIQYRKHIRILRKTSLDLMLERVLLYESFLYIFRYLFLLSLEAYKEYEDRKQKN